MMLDCTGSTLFPARNSGEESIEALLAALIELKQKELIRHVSPNTTPGKKISAVVLGGINPEGKLLKILT